MASPRPKLVVFLQRDPGDLAAPAAEQFRATLGQLGMGWSAEVWPAATSPRPAVEAARYAVHFDAWDAPTENAERWPADPARLDAEVAGLVARLFTGAKRSDVLMAPVAGTPKVEKPPKPVKKHVVKVGRETKGRRGKGVTLVSELPPGLGEAGVAELAATLKNRCGTGGTVKDGVIEIQGDQRERVAAELERLGYQVKRAGG